MARQVALAAELLARRHDADPEQPLPDPVHDHAGRERVGGIDEPLGEREPIDAVTLGHRRIVEHVGHAFPDLVAEVLPVASELDVRGPPLVARELLEHRHRRRRRVGELLPQAGDNLPGRPKLRRLRPILRDGLREFGDARLDFGDLALERRSLGVDLRPRDPHHGRLVPAIGVGRVVEDRVELKVFALRQRVVFVVVALRAGQRRAHPGAQRRVHAIDDGDGAKLLVDRAPFVVGERVAVEAGGDLVVERGARQQVAGDLPDRKAIEGHVGIERADHPVPPAPDRARVVLGVAGRVGVAGEIQPLPRLVLAVTVVGEESVDEPLDGVGRAIGDEGIDLLGRGRQAHEVGVEPADERGPIGLGRRREPRRLDLREHEAIDVVPHPVGLLHLGGCGALWRIECPVRLVVRPLLDPAVEQLFLVFRKPPIGVRRRHQNVGIGRVDPFEDRARAGVARHDRAGVDRRLTVVEPQIGLPLLAVLAVAIEAVFRQDRPDVAVELERLRGLGGQSHRQARGPCAHRQCGHKKRTATTEESRATHGTYSSGLPASPTLRPKAGDRGPKGRSAGRLRTV
jgi:hypothetical protein